MTGLQAWERYGPRYVGISDPDIHSYASNAMRDAFNAIVSKLLPEHLAARLKSLTDNQVEALAALLAETRKVAANEQWKHDLRLKKFCADEMIADTARLSIHKMASISLPKDEAKVVRDAVDGLYSQEIQSLHRLLTNGVHK